MDNRILTLPDLLRELRRLRAIWPEAWVGLPAVAEACMRQLGHDSARGIASLAPADQAIAACMTSVASAIEEDGARRHRAATEPRYHHRLHIADTLTALTCLLLATREEDGHDPDACPAHHEWLMMLAMLAHDFLHTGRVNQVPAEIEQASVDALQPFMLASGVAPHDRQQIAELILMTDPARVRPHHQQMRGQAFDPASIAGMAMLLQESDILASAMPEIGLALTHDLAAEWSQFSATMAQALLAPGRRAVFLREQACFSSPASRRLGIQAIIDGEIDALERAGVQPQP